MKSETNTSYCVANTTPIAVPMIQLAPRGLVTNTHTSSSPLEYQSLAVNRYHHFVSGNCECSLGKMLLGFGTHCYALLKQTLVRFADASATPSASTTASLAMAGLSVDDTYLITHKLTLSFRRSRSELHICIRFGRFLGPQFEPLRSATLTYTCQLPESTFSYGMS